VTRERILKYAVDYNFLKMNVNVSFYDEDENKAISDDKN
jgi:hypothetical protein